MYMDRYVAGAVIDMEQARRELLAALEAVGEADWGRYVPYGSRRLQDLLLHVAAADQVWAVAARDLLKGESMQEVAAPRDSRTGGAPGDERAISPAALIDEMQRRRRLLLSLYELLEPRHLPLALTAFGAHNSARERIWRGYHDRLHASDVHRALAMRWHPQRLVFLPEVEAAVRALDPSSVLYVIYSIDPVFWERPSPLPGWTYRQLLAHIATGDWVLLGHLRHIIETDTLAAWPDVDAGNERLLAERAYSTERALTDEFLSSRHETMRLLSQLKPQHLELSIEFWWEERPNRHTVLDYVTMFHVHQERHAEQLRPAMRYLR
jgi:hypothetical protein